MPYSKPSGRGNSPRSGQLNTRLTPFRYAERLWETLDTPVALSCSLLLKYGEYDQLAVKTVEASNYRSSGDFFLDYQAVSILSKLESLPTKINRRAQALRKFVEAERQCHATNERLISRSTRGSYPPNGAVAAVMHRAQQKISSILGPVPSMEAVNFSFGPGAAFGVRGETAVYNKLHTRLECAVAMLPHLGEVLSQAPVWSSDERRPVHLVEGSELTFVPKNAKTDRSICIEPLLNGFVQKGFGSYMRDQLSTWGIDLRDQSVNQKLASRAHTEGLCTIDFSAASDTVAYGLVLDLLPFDWVEALDVARCPGFRLGKSGKWREFAKFSSMGNAYTFELETLIFFALAISSCEVAKVPYEVGPQGNLHVYGDDVIIPKGSLELFLSSCSYAGFTINTEKTFTAGPFFESCGCDYYDGQLVRPFFIKKDVKVIEDANYLANSTLELAARLLGCIFSEWQHGERVVAGLQDLHSWVVGGIPRKLRFLGPYGSGDGSLFCDFSVALPTRPRGKREGWEGFDYRAVARPPVRVPVSDVRLCYALYFAGRGIAPWSKRGRSRRVGKASLWLNELAEIGVPEPLDNGTGYDVRKRTKFRVVKTFSPGPWPTIPIPWGEKSIALVDTMRKVKHTSERRRVSRR